MPMTTSRHRTCAARSRAGAAFMTSVRGLPIRRIRRMGRPLTDVMNAAPARDRAAQVRWREVVIGMVLGVLFLLPLLVYGPGEDEEGALGIFSSQVHYAALLHGKWLFWLNNLGFGTPL